MNGTIDEAARAAGWDGNVSLTEFIKTMGADLSRVQRCNAELIEDAETHKEQERRLKRELAEARAEIAKVRHAYNQQHDVWEELYVKDGLKRLRERAEAYDIVWGQLKHLVDAVSFSTEERNAVQYSTSGSLSKRANIMANALDRVMEATRTVRARHVEPSAGELSFAQRLEYFAREAVKAPEHGAVSSRGREEQFLPGVPLPASLERTRRDSEALFHLLESLCTLPEGLVQAHTVREAARRAWLIIAGGK